MRPQDMPAGTEIDRLVAAGPMGWKWMRYHDLSYRSPDGPARRTLCNPRENWLTAPDYVEWDPLDRRQGKMIPCYFGPRFSAEMGHAWTVVEALAAKGLFATVSQRAAVAHCAIEDYDGEQLLRIKAATAPLAICRAALMAMAPKGGR